jgi:PAS domain-containing protein
MTGANAGRDGSGIYAAGALGFYSWNVPDNRVHGDEVIAFVFGLTQPDLAEGAPIETVIRNVQEDDKKRVAKAIHTAIVTGEPYQADYRVTHPDGRTVFVSANGCCLRDAAGTPSIYAGTVTIQPEGMSSGSGDPLEIHTRAALGIATKRRHSLAARYLSSALNVIGK